MSTARASKSSLCSLDSGLQLGFHRLWQRNMKAGCPAHQNTTKPTCSILVTGIRLQMEDPSKLSYDSPGPTKNHSLFQEDKVVSDIIIQGRVTPCMFQSGQLLHVDASESSVDLCLRKDKPPTKHAHPSGGQGSTLKDTTDCRNQVFDACLNIADGEKHPATIRSGQSALPKSWPKS